MNILSFTHSLKLSVQPRYSSLWMLNTHPQVVPNQYEFFGGGTMELYTGTVIDQNFHFGVNYPFKQDILG